jgi:hypothetical protein
MARYIDIDKAIPMMIQMCVDIVGHGITQVDAVRIATMLEDASVEDVATKSEVAREIFEEIDRYTIESDFDYIFLNKKFLAELKKKYTEPDAE